MDRSRLELGDYLPYLINRVGSVLVTRFVDEHLAAQGISIADWRVLASLSNHGPQRQIDVAEQTSIDVSTISRLIARMLRNGLVTRERSPQSNREVVIQLTRKGQVVLDRLIPPGRHLEKIAVDGLSAHDVDIVRRSLRHMYGNLTRSTKVSKADASMPPRRQRKVVSGRNR